jgi:prolyl oligopeptidase
MDTSFNSEDDRHLYLEEVEGTRALEWVGAENRRTLGVMAEDARFEPLQRELLDILQATDRLVVGGFSKGGCVDSFWQDASHTRGLWRRAKLDDYLQDRPQWETLLDIDALAEAEGKNWVFKSAVTLPGDERFCLVALSDGGKDAVVYREYDTVSRAFLPKGFSLPEGKQNVSWIDKDALYVSREWETGMMTNSGYPYVTKRLERGQRLEDAVTVFAGEKTDIMASRSVLRDIDKRAVMDIEIRRTGMFENHISYLTPTGPVSFPLPLDTEIVALHCDQIVFRLKSDWTSAGNISYRAGTLISFELQAGLANPDGIAPLAIFAPQAHQTVAEVGQTRNRIVVQLLSNVVGEIRSFEFAGGGWQEQTVKTPKNAMVSLAGTDTETDNVFLLTSGYLQPATLYLADARSGQISQVKSAPARFDGSGLRVEQRWATSTDGTKIPYFLVAPDNMPLDGSTPTLIYAYGGFEIPLLPAYSSTVGKGWLEKGGAYVVANIRGGGEFGPSWHQAGLKTKRQLIYDDFQAVAKDLIAAKVTSPRQLGIMGGSNGGLLMGVQLTQRPDLWNAVVIQVPLLDMLRFHHLLAGASWISEFGDPEVPDERAFLEAISPYHNLKTGIRYPEPFFVTSTKDDRVHPGHARKMAARMQEMGLPFLYYENTDGGHAAAANLPEAARRMALEFTYLYRKLMD